VKCGKCGATIDLTLSACAACGAEVELGRLTGILGAVCRACDAYNEPGARTCAACGKPLAEGVEKEKDKPIPLVASCPRCGAEAGAGRFCARCGQPLGARGTQVVMRPIPPSGRVAAQVPGALAPRRARLVLETGTGQEGATYELAAETVEAGRSKGAIVFPDDACLAPHHATFLYRHGALHVRDEGAPGGVFLRLRDAVPLRPGDHFAVGERLLRYAGPLPPPPAQPPDGTRRLGAPRPAAPAIVVEEWLEGGAAGRVFVRAGPSVVVGRAGCAVSLGDDPTVSATHAELQVDAAGNVRLKDLGSSNGTLVRLPPRAERELYDGDRVRLGREVLRAALA
jgi:pSer/pThr/pTyr-binding forkhead associated (FHA) protein